MALHPDRSRLMPQPALHLLLARQALERWRASASTPFDVTSDEAVNAFLHGSLGPDMGNFPGGSTRLAHVVHTCRTGDLQRRLFQTAATDAERAYAAGWLSHILADVLIHPLVNDAAARIAINGTSGIVEHVRVEVGLDVWFCSQHPSLLGVRLRPAFDRAGYRFLGTALNQILTAAVTPAQLVQMERGLMLFSHAALHFATTVARRLCWEESPAEQVPLGSAVLWHAASALSPRNSVVNAYLNPLEPDSDLVHSVQDAIARFDALFDAALADDARHLPNFNLEDGTIAAGDDLRVA